MSSPALPGPSQRPPKRQRTPDFEESLQGPSNPAKRLRPSEMSIDDMNRVDALLSVDDGPATVAQRDEPMETDLPMIPTADKGKGRMTDEAPTSTSSANSRSAPDDDSRNQRVVEDLEAELSCGCCAGLVYRPMILQPCQHFFCGSCLKQWIENANSNTCPECRTACTHATASRTIQSIVDLLIRNRPDLQRTENERQQADEICAPCNEIKMPQPKPPNPDALIPQAAARNEPGFDHVARPCPHCLPNNQFGWQCPRPIADPDTDPEHAWNLDDGKFGLAFEIHVKAASDSAR
ncbi:hypothetical protein DL93DRAFT_2075880 [Clavulina sp. PMI_390]|nr:hypothetical protein DL93DRAFT_2075880 [Clavulina sp. PMI_390]